MYIWKINELKKQIVENGLSEAQVFYYVLLYVGFTAVAVELTGYFPTEAPNVWDHIESGLSVLIPIIGTVCAYRANRGAQGTGFAAKYFSIGFVVTVRFIVYLVPVFLVMLIYYFSLSTSEQSMQSGWFDVLVFSAWYAALYASLVKHIRDTTKA